MTSKSTIQTAYAEWRNTPGYPAHWISGGAEVMLNEAINKKEPLTIEELRWLAKTLEALAMAQEKGTAAVEEITRALAEKAPARARKRRCYPGEGFMPDMDGDLEEIWKPLREKK